MSRQRDSALDEETGQSGAALVLGVDSEEEEDIEEEDRPPSPPPPPSRPRNWKRTLRWVNGIATVVCLATGIAAVADREHTELIPITSAANGPDRVGVLPVKEQLGFALLSVAVYHCAMVCAFRDEGASLMTEKWNPIRWMERTVTEPIVRTAVLAVIGATDLPLLIALAVQCALWNANLGVYEATAGGWPSVVTSALLLASYWATGAQFAAHASKRGAEMVTAALLSDIAISAPTIYATLCRRPISRRYERLDLFYTAVTIASRQALVWIYYNTPD